jgi:hypothetical protein
MSSNPTHPQVNRRYSRRQPPRSNVQIECRKGCLGLGRNLALSLLDLSETGARLMASTGLDDGQEVELVIRGGTDLKRPARVVWTLPAENNRFVVGIHFQSCLAYGDLQRLSSPPRSMR